MRQFLKQEVIDKIKDNDPVIFQIATVMNRKYRTVIYWLTNNDIILTTSTILTIIKDSGEFPEGYDLTELREEPEEARA